MLYFLTTLAFIFNFVIIFNYIKHKYFIDILLDLISIIISYLIIIWINKLEKLECKCSDTKERNYIKFGWYFIIVISVISLIIHILNNFYKKFMFDYELYKLIYTLLFGSVIIITIYYIYELKKKKCTCSEDYKREIAYYYSIIEFILYLSSLSGFIIMMYLYSLKNRLYV
jgi:hypothetical protein